MRFNKKFSIYIFPMLMVFTLLFSEVKGQNLEVGISGGGAYMLNDSVRAMPFKNGGYSIGAIARYNLNTRWAFRLSYNYNKIRYNKQGKINKDTTVINDISLISEFNFLDYATGSKHNVFSPYIFGGFSIFSYKGTKETKISEALTFGAGVKYSLTKKIGVGFEWGMRKTFTDSLDNDDIKGGFLYGSDWYNITALTITYKLDIFNCNKCKDQIW